MGLTLGTYAGGYADVFESSNNWFSFEEVGATYTNEAGEGYVSAFLSGDGLTLVVVDCNQGIRTSKVLQLPYVQIHATFDNGNGAVN